MQKHSIAVLSDVHSYYQELKCVVEHCLSNGVTDFIVLGDVVYGGSEPGKSLELLHSLNTLAWIRGNTDDWVIFEEKWKEAWEAGHLEEGNNKNHSLSNDEVTFLRNLPICQKIELDGYQVTCCHGSPKSNKEGIEEYIKSCSLNPLDSDLLLCGHTHKPAIFEHEGVIVFQVGSTGIKNTHTDDKLNYGLIEISEDEIKCSQVYINFK
ncbi:MAG: YfcE family phosphodiesterase [Herbinix sp.]|jgi:putative phosphoesterase|nr:YfcE family phosphodiesterase [Herbinix sp.]